MTKKQEQAIRILYRDGVTFEDAYEAKIEPEKRKHLINGRLYYSNSCGTFDEQGSFLCSGPYAVFIKGRETYNKFSEIKHSDTRYYKVDNHIDNVFRIALQMWDDYLCGKYITTSKEGDLEKDWESKSVSLSIGDVYMILDTMLNTVYLDHALKFLKPKVHWIIVEDKLSPVIFTDGENLAFVCSIKH